MKRPTAFRRVAVSGGFLIWAALACAALGNHASAQQPAVTSAGSCGPVAIPGHYGPYDYVTQRSRLAIVDQYHFTTKVERLVGGESGFLGHDLSYTLNAAPNHHRALLAAMNFAKRTKSGTPPHMHMSVECYFDRATRFKPSDTIVRRLYAMYLAHLQRVPEARRQLELAEFFAKEDKDGLALHNIGLVYLELGLQEDAARIAQDVEAPGFEASRLRQTLKELQQGKEPAK